MVRDDNFCTAVTAGVAQVIDTGMGWIDGMAVAGMAGTAEMLALYSKCWIRRDY